jgi:hypothetical protein
MDALRIRSRLTIKEARHIAAAAITFWRDANNQQQMFDRESSSTYAPFIEMPMPDSFINLMNTIESFSRSKPRWKKLGAPMIPATAVEALKLWDEGQSIDTVALADEKGNVLINQPELWARVMDLIRKVLGIINPGDLQDTYYAQGFLPMCFRLGVVPPPTTAGPGEAKRYNAVTWMAFQLLKDGFAMVVSRTPAARQRITVKK